MAYYYNQLPNYSGSGGGTGGNNPAGTYGQDIQPRGIAPEVFGGNPGVVEVPNIYGQMSSIVPTLPATNLQIGQNILSKSQGRLSPEQIGNTQDAMARFGMDSGMGMSGLATNLGARSVGSDTAAIQEGALKDYTSLFPTISKTQIVDPAIQSQIAMFNATNQAKEDPFWGAMMGGMGGGGGGGGGGM
jgi:hypothetical protein